MVSTRLSDSVGSRLANLCMSGMWTVSIGLLAQASLRYMTSSFNNHLLSCMQEKLEGNGEGELCESYGNSCQKHLIKYVFISSCVTASINRDALKWPFRGAINHGRSKVDVWVCTQLTKLFTVVTRHNLQWREVRHRRLKSKFNLDITDYKTFSNTGLI